MEKQKFTFYIDETAVENRVFCTLNGDITLTKVVIEADNLEEAIEIINEAE